MNQEKYISLIYKNLKGEASASELSELSQWLAATDDNRQLEKIVRKDWGFSNQYAPEIEVDVKADFAKLRQRIRVEESGAPPVAKVVQMKPRRRRWMAIAAAAVALLAAGWWLVFNNAGAEMLVVETAVGEKQNLELSDGTKIWLNENSRLEYPIVFEDYNRPVQLTGEGYFEVAKNAHKPFVIKTKEADITVLGTAFNVRAIETENEMIVSVEEGKVKLQPLGAKQALILKKGDKGFYYFSEGRLHRDLIAKDNSLFWKTGTLVFENMPLENVVADLEKYFSVKINLEKNGMENCLMTGRFPKATANDILEYIAGQFKMGLNKVSEDSFELSGGFCN